jgi:hypothetical protein
MINSDSIEAYNNRLTVDMSNINKLTPAQLDQVRHYGSQAETLMKNRDLAMFVHHFKFSLADELAGIRGHTADDNANRIAISNQLTGIDNFVSSLKKAVYLKNRVGNTEVPNT